MRPRGTALNRSGTSRFIVGMDGGSRPESRPSRGSCPVASGEFVKDSPAWQASRYTWSPCPTSRYTQRQTQKPQIAQKPQMCSVWRENFPSPNQGQRVFVLNGRDPRGLVTPLPLPLPTPTGQCRSSAESAASAQSAFAVGHAQRAPASLEPCPCAVSAASAVSAVSALVVGCNGIQARRGGS